MRRFWEIEGRAGTTGREERSGPEEDHGAEWLTGRLFLLLLATALLAAFPKVLLGFDTFFYRDFAALRYAGNFYGRERLLHGELPLWDPYNHCGVPYLAQMGQWYPPNLFGLLLPLPWTANFLILAHLLWGGLGMRWLAHRLGLGPFAAAFAGLAYVFNGVTLSCLIWDQNIASLAWLPWVVGCVRQTWRQGGAWTMAAAASSAMQVLTGTPEITLMTWLFLGALWLSEWIARQASLRASVFRMGSAVLLAAGITMVQVLPFWDLLRHSQRDPARASNVWSMPGWGWANLVVPLFHCYQAPQGPWFQSGQDLLPSYYLGAGVLALGVAAAWLTRSRFTAVLAGTALFCWVMALGSDGRVYDWVRRAFPVMGIARFPVKFAILPAFLVPLLAAQAIDRIRTRPDGPTRRCLAGVAAVAVLLMASLVWFARVYPFPDDRWSATAWNAFWRAALLLVIVGGVWWLTKIKAGSGRKVLQLAVLTMLPLDALTHSPDIAPTLPSANLAPGIWQASGKPPPPKLGEGRIMISPDAERQLFYSRVVSQQLDFTGKRLAEWYNLNLLDGIPKVTGAMPLRPAHFDELERQIYYNIGSHYGRGLLDFLSVAWGSAPDNPVQWVARTNYLPIMTAGQQAVFASDEKTFAAILADDFDPRSVVYLPEAARGKITVSKPALCTLRQVRFTAERVEADTDCAAPSLVVLSQSFYHCWQAFVDDQPVELWRANLAFQALQVPAGTHHVKLVYRDRYFEIGALVSLLSLAFCGGISFRAYWVRK